MVGKEDELIATETEYNIPIASGILDAEGNFGEETVTLDVAIGVVDGLEAAYVEAQECKTTRRATCFGQSSRCATERVRRAAAAVTGLAPRNKALSTETRPSNWSGAPFVDCRQSRRHEGRLSPPTGTTYH